ncbi:MAG: MBL fold metallo-hydrolase [Methanosarcinaceae archaeon]|nr:MBL fold metallo-hydrolase [Methanosarcinaceae archaeon]
MKLTVLVDNNTLIDRYFLAEPGLSFLIETAGTKILFDTGYSEIFLTNARKMGISLLDLDFLVLSHGHLDHTWGLDPFFRLLAEAKIEGYPCKSPTLVAHPFAFLSKRFKGVGEIGSLLSPEKLAEHFELRLSDGPLWLTENLLFLGEIPRNFDFENGEAIGHIVKEGGEQEADCLFDDTALVYRAKEGLVVITGCSHAGICNITEYARKVCGEEKVLDIIGGFHLLNPSEIQMNGTIEYLKRLGPECIHACHCTDLYSKIELAKGVDLKEVGVGMRLEYD